MDEKQKIILIIGDCNSIFVKNYINDVLLPKYKVVVISEGDNYDHYKAFYDENSVDVILLWENTSNWIRQIPFVRSIVGPLLLAPRLKHTYGSFFMVHIHGLNALRGRMLFAVGKITRHSAITVWGQELLRKNKRQLSSLKCFYDRAEHIALANQKMKIAFSEAYGTRYEDRMFINDYALDLLPKIDTASAKYSREELCHCFGIDNPATILVCVGHNGRAEQRHIDICHELAKLSEELKEKITLLFTMTYGSTLSYREQVETSAKSSGINYVVVNRYMSEEDLAKYRLICDIMIHSQQTDAFSASIQECMYAGTIVINGSWLPYEDIENYHSRVIEYDRLEQIPERLSHVIANYEQIRLKFADNRRVIKDLLSEERTTSIWKQNLCI